MNIVFMSMDTLHQCRKKFRSVLGDTAPPAAGAVRP